MRTNQQNRPCAGNGPAAALPPWGFKALLVLSLAVLGTASAQADVGTVAPRLQTALGTVEGLRHDGTDVFLGIPFAAPPTGARRLAPPEAPQPWPGVLLATVPPSACPQLASPDPAGLASSNEDCLYLNVWRPTQAAAAGPRPVIVWFHGGGFVEGYGAARQYDGTRLAAATGAVVVTTNYRVGALGFLAASALDAADGRHVSGNYGLLDAQAALRWVAQNIRAFGGDPGQVTVMGESAGANAVLGLLASPASQNLFARAIVQSSTDGAHTVPLAQAERDTYAHALDEIGCRSGPGESGPGVLDCLRSVRVESFLRMTVKPTMVQDGTVLPLDPFDALRQGRFVRVPVLIGSNAKENYLFTARTETDVLRHVVADGDLPGLMASGFGAKAGDVAQQYRPDEYVTPSARLGSALTDRRFSCMANLARTGMAAFVPVYGYQLDIADPVQQQPLVPGSDLPNLSYHTTDLGYVFDNDNDGRALTGRHAALARMAQRYWAGFAATGTPGPADENVSVMAWPRFTKEDPVLLSLSDTPHPKRDFADEHRCAFWEQSGLVGPTW